MLYRKVCFDDFSVIRRKTVQTAKAIEIASVKEKKYKLLIKPNKELRYATINESIKSVLTYKYT